MKICAGLNSGIYAVNIGKYGFMRLIMRASKNQDSGLVNLRYSKYNVQVPARFSSSAASNSANDDFHTHLLLDQENKPIMTRAQSLDSSSLLTMATRAFLKRWCADPAVWPIIGTMGAACALVGYQSSRYIFSSPDVRWDRQARSEILRTNFEEGEVFAKHFESMAALKENTIRKQKDEIYRTQAAV